MARRKTSSVSNRRQTSLLMVSSRPVAILLSAALVALEAHTRTALVRKVAFPALVDRDRSQVDLLVRSVCPHLPTAALPAGSHQVRASTSPQGPSHHTCRAVLQDCTTRTSRLLDRGVLPNKRLRLAKRRRQVGSQRLPRRMAHPSQRRRSKVRSRQETHRPQLQLPSKLHRPRSTRSQTSHLRLLLHMHSLRNRVPRHKADRRVVVSFPPFLFPALEPPRQSHNHSHQQ
jgi:hypothetical protein